MSACANLTCGHDRARHGGHLTGYHCAERNCGCEAWRDAADYLQALSDDKLTDQPTRDDSGEES